jgi:hypothetical protein
MAGLLPVLALGACADYVKHRDTITASAGDAKAHNSVVHITDPWPPAAANTRITGNGQRVDRVTKQYITGNDNRSTTAAPAFTVTPSSDNSQPPQ